MTRQRIPAAIRFHRHYSEGDGCWEWQSAIFKGLGYGKFHADNRRVVYAHRFAFELANGPIPTGMFVCHRCDNRRCVRPDHLFLGTAKDNVADMMAKGRHVMRGVPGMGHGRAILTDDQVREIRRRFVPGKRGECPRAAKEFGVSISTISKVLRRELWAHL